VVTILLLRSGVRRKRADAQMPLLFLATLVDISPHCLANSELPIVPRAVHNRAMSTRSEEGGGGESYPLLSQTWSNACLVVKRFLGSTTAQNPLVSSSVHNVQLSILPSKQLMKSLASGDTSHQ
jgi:hypothetical protein